MPRKCKGRVSKRRKKTDAVSMPKTDAMPRAQNTRATKASSSAVGSNDADVADGTSAQQTHDTVSTTLLGAANVDDVLALVRLLKDGADSQQRDRRGNTALHLAAIQGHLSAAWVLLGFGVPVDLPGALQRTPLHCAAAHGRLQVAQRLLDAGAKVSVLDECGDTALALAVKKGHKDVEALLLHRDASVDVCLSEGDTLLVHAAKAEQWEIVQLLLEKGASATECKEAKESPLALAAKAGRADVVSDLLRRGAASEIKQVKEAVNATETSAVVWAFAEALSNTDSLIQLSVRGLRAAEEGNTQLLAVLLDTGTFDPSTFNVFSYQSLLHLAAGNGHLACVEELLQRGATVDAIDHSADSPLHLASRAGHAHCARALLAAGASTTIRNCYTYTPLDEARNDDVRAVFQASE